MDSLDDPSKMDSPKTFLGVEGFCPKCGCILPILTSRGPISCYICKEVFEPEVLGQMMSTYMVHFNSRESIQENASKLRKEKNKSSEAENPVVERKCVKCGNNNMSYTTLQLRSADEGQTVFFTCTNCGHKETENS